MRKMFETNYHLNQSELSYSFKFNKMSVRNSFDAGYESLLSSSIYSSSASSTGTNDSSLFSQPTTPIKTSQYIINLNQTSKTPDFKQEYVADLNSYYLASIKNQTQTCSDTFMSPIKQSNFNHFSSNSNSNSPITKVTQSPKFALNPDNYVHERDCFKSKLLRSPAFKLNNIIPPNSHQPQIKSFSSRFQLNYTSLSSPTVQVKPSVTEEEFMQMLIKNKHLPSNPEFLIGWHMGLDHIDFLTELSNRSMDIIVDKIFDYLKVTDLVRVGCVSKSWRSIVKKNKFNKKRTEFIQQKKTTFETFKENRESFIKPDSGKTRMGLSLEEKRNLLKNYRLQNSIDLDKKGEDVNANLVKNANGSFVFASLDLNTINNITSGNVNYNEFLNNSMNSKKKKIFVKDDEDEMMIDLVESPSKKKKPDNQMSNEVNKELFNACNSLFESINKTQYVNQKPNRFGLLETEFKQISIDDSAKLTKTNNINQLVEHSPKFICKNLKLSPSKKQLSLDSTSSNSCKIDLIGSKKSKKNLKRL